MTKENGVKVLTDMVADIREICSAFQPELKNTCILTAWTVQLYSKTLVLCHCLIKNLWKCSCFL